MDVLPDEVAGFSRVGDAVHYFYSEASQRFLGERGQVAPPIVPDGFGLGLAIAAWIVAAQGGRSRRKPVRGRNCVRGDIPAPRRGVRLEVVHDPGINAPRVMENRLRLWL